MRRSQGRNAKELREQKCEQKKTTPHFNSLAGERIKNSFIDTKNTIRIRYVGKKREI